MNDIPRFFFSMAALVLLMVLTALSPALGAMAANLIRPAVEMATKRAGNLQRLLRFGGGSGTHEDQGID